MSDREKVTCPVCNGTGRMDEGTAMPSLPCDRCGGKGWIYEDEAKP